MIITSQGFGHFKKGMNNQDFGVESDKMLLVLDGCSSAKYAESGTRLFAQLFSRKEDWDNLEKFEDNVKSVFDDIIGLSEKYYTDRKSLEVDYIMENLLFTIIACFDEGDKYVVKIFGDGYIVSQNVQGLISYMRFSYGDYPPYFGYKYCYLQDFNYQNYEFKTFTFDKSAFKKIVIATDGIMPLVIGRQKDLESGIANGNIALIEMAITDTNLFDDVTIGIFGGKKNGYIQ